MVFQDPLSSLNPVFTIGYQMVEAVRAHQRVSRKQARELALDWMERAGVDRPSLRFRAYPHGLSGGMLQRVMIAIALSCEPRLLIADEPTTALDVTIQAQILDLLADLTKEYGLTMLFISHDLAVIRQIADRIAVMYHGKLVEEGPTAQVFDSPSADYTRALLAAIPGAHAA